MRAGAVARHRLDAFARLAYIYGDLTVDDDPEWAVEMVDYMVEDPDYIWPRTIPGEEPPARISPLSPGHSPAPRSPQPLQP